MIVCAVLKWTDKVIIKTKQIIMNNNIEQVLLKSNALRIDLKCFSH